MDNVTLFANQGVDINVSNLTKVYKTAAEEVSALKGVDFSVKSGQAVAIMGPSGCGKSTLMNLIGGVDNPTSGILAWETRKYRRLPKEGWNNTGS